MAMRYLLLAFVFLISLFPAFSQDPYFFPKATKINPAIPEPEAFLGYKIGSQHPATTAHSISVNWIAYPTALLLKHGNF
jgi:hypothetical protein